MQRQDFDDVDLMDGVSPTADGKSTIRSVLHQSLHSRGITVHHRPRTGNDHAVIGGVANNVVTNYVEHAFLTWLLLTKHGIGMPDSPPGTNCSDESVDPDLFFMEDVNPEDFLSDDFYLEDGSVSPRGMTLAQEFAAATDRNAKKCQDAKKVCSGCNFSLDCLTKSIINREESGVWGGLDEDERHLMINRFEAMRYSYNNKKMKPSMRADFESHAAQIATAIRSAARAA